MPATSPLKSDQELCDAVIAIVDSTPIPLMIAHLLLLATELSDKLQLAGVDPMPILEEHRELAQHSRYDA